MINTLKKWYGRYVLWLVFVNKGKTCAVDWKTMELCAPHIPPTHTHTQARWICKSGLMAPVIKVWKTVVLRAIWPLQAMLKRFQRRITSSGQETIFVIFWQSMWLLSALIQQTLLGLICSFVLISLAEGILSQPNINCATWSLTCTSKEKRSKQSKEK